MTDKKTQDIQKALFSGETVNLTWDEYIAIFKDKEARGRSLQMALNSAGAFEKERQNLPFQPPEK